MYGYTQKTDDKNELINKNMSIVKKIAFFYIGRVHQVIELLSEKLLGARQVASHREAQREWEVR